MIERRKNTNYLKRTKCIRGSGFRDVISYIGQNKDLIAKPMLAAAGEIGALSLKEGARAIIKKLISEKRGSGIKKF